MPLRGLLSLPAHLSAFRAPSGEIRTSAADAGRELLVVAGDIPLGTGILFGLEKPHDGVVRVEETRVEGARAVVVRASHVGLLLSRRVAALLCDHLRNG